MRIPQFSPRESKMKISKEFHMDKRLVARNIRDGLIDQAAYDAHVESLPDVAESSAILEIEMADVGVKNVDAKETDETE